MRAQTAMRVGQQWFGKSIAQKKRFAKKLRKAVRIGRKLSVSSMDSSGRALPWRQPKTGTRASSNLTRHVKREQRAKQILSGIYNASRSRRKR